MENKKNRFLSVHYQLYTVKDGERVLEEQTTREHPFEFVSGFGVSLDALEQHIIGLEKGTPFDFTLQPSEAFGDYHPEGVHKLSRDIFTIDGKFDHEGIYVGAVITLTDTEHNQFMAKVKKVEEDGVTVDTNHPLAGQTLNFTGIVVENREATEQEITRVIKMLAGDSSCGGCHGCGGGGCEGDGCESDGCGGKGCGGCH